MKAINIDFLRWRRVAYVLSAVLLLSSFLLLGVRGLNFGMEFTGGVLVEATYPKPPELDAIRATLNEAGYAGATVQSFGSDRDVLVRLPPQLEKASVSEIREDVAALLRRGDPAVDLRRVELLDPQVGDELAEQGGMAVLIALLLILVYISIRFQWKFSVGAVAALAHDVVITLGLFSLLQISFDLAVLAALLAVIGYSLNDTIVIFDRVRENFARMRRESAEAVMNASLNQTLARTLVTSSTTLLVLLALLFIGGDALYGFSIALIAGVVIGTYSSIYLAAAVALELKVTPLDLQPPRTEEDKELEELP